MCSLHFLLKVTQRTCTSDGILNKNICGSNGILNRNIRSSNGILNRNICSWTGILNRNIFYILGPCNIQEDMVVEHFKETSTLHAKFQFNYIYFYSEFHLNYIYFYSEFNLNHIYFYSKIPSELRTDFTLDDFFVYLYFSKDYKFCYLVRCDLNFFFFIVLATFSGVN
jgi:hypothetical protein